MKIIANGNEVIITEAFSGVGFRTEEGETLGVCMRDGGFEINYGGWWYRLRDNHVDPLGRSVADTTVDGWSGGVEG